MAAACASVVLVAVAAEVVGGSFANSQVAPWAERLVPLAWPAPIRVLWWTAVAAAALGYRLAMRRLGFRQPWPLIAASVVPFLSFAAGIAAGAGWATWH